MALRVPMAELPPGLRENMIKQLGAVPEPIVAEDVELADSVSIAMLTVLETLTPAERAVFVLREVFEMPYGEIAEAVGKSAGTVRQIARRAREHVAARLNACRLARSDVAHIPIHAPPVQMHCPVTRARGLAVPGGLWPCMASREQPRYALPALCQRGRCR